MPVPERPAACILVAGARTAGDPHVREQSLAVLTAAHQRGWPGPVMYTEIGLPGWQRASSALNQLAGYGAVGRYHAIIVADLSRFSRVLASPATAPQCGPTVEAVDEGRVDESAAAALYARRQIATP